MAEHVLRGWSTREEMLIHCLPDDPYPRTTHQEVFERSGVRGAITRHTEEGIKLGTSWRKSEA